MPTGSERVWHIGELASLSGVSARTIRYYESIGLVAPARRSDGGYRLYDRSSLERLGFVRKAQQLGLSLAEVREVARLREGGAEPCAHVVALLDQQIERAERAQTELRRFARELRGLRAAARRRRATGAAAVCRIIEHRAVGIDARGLLPLLRAKRTP